MGHLHCAIAHDDRRLTLCGHGDRAQPRPRSQVVTSRLTSRINAADCARSLTFAVWTAASLTISPFNGLAARVVLGGLMHRVRKKEPRHPVRG